MQIEYSNSEEDYNNFHKYLLLRRIRSRSAAHVIVIILLWIICFNNTRGFSINTLVFIPVAAIYLGLIYFIPFYALKRKLLESIAAEPSSLEKKRLTVTEEGLLIESASKTVTWHWESVNMAEANDDFIFLTLADKRYLLFPKTSFGSGANAVAFLGLVQRQIYGFESGQINTLKAKSQPPYLLGLLCIIPMVGAFVGFGLIMSGILQYKDKWLVLIGAAGIIWTIGVYGSMQYSLRHSDLASRAMVPIAQDDLNSLVKYIEFYKVEHGVYPDSLQQVSTESDRASIADPVQAFKDYKKTVYFNYRRVGGHYYLFSSGLDGIPNTADDIYPNLPAADTNKIGLIIKKQP